MTAPTITQHGDSTYDSFVVTGIPGIEQVEVTAEVGQDGDPDPAAIERAREAANRIAALFA